jgi:CheY-like chemotaxis protein
MTTSILVIDDDVAITRLIDRVLRRNGFDVAVAADGRQGLALLERVQPDLVITDLFMPEVDGLEIIRRMRADGHDAKIIAISGEGRLAFKSYLGMATHLGANAVLAKPFEPAALVEVVRTLVGTA